MIPPHGKYTSDDYETAKKALKYSFVFGGWLTIVIVCFEVFFK